MFGTEKRVCWCVAAVVVALHAAFGEGDNFGIRLWGNGWPVQVAPGENAIRIFHSSRSVKQSAISHEVLFWMYEKDPFAVLPHGRLGSPGTTWEAVRSFRVEAHGKQYHSLGALVAELGIPELVSMWRWYRGTPVVMELQYDVWSSGYERIVVEVATNENRYYYIRDIKLMGPVPDARKGQSPRSGVQWGQCAKSSRESSTRREAREAARHHWKCESTGNGSREVREYGKREVRRGGRRTINSPASRLPMFGKFGPDLPNIGKSGPAGG